jgi:hypothetical protein
VPYSVKEYSTGAGGFPVLSRRTMSSAVNSPSCCASTFCEIVDISRYRPAKCFGPSVGAKNRSNHVGVLMCKRITRRRSDCSCENNLRGALQRWQAVRRLCGSTATATSHAQSAQSHSSAPWPQCSLARQPYPRRHTSSRCRVSTPTRLNSTRSR